MASLLRGRPARRVTPTETDMPLIAYVLLIPAAGIVDGPLGLLMFIVAAIGIATLKPGD